MHIDLQCLHSLKLCLSLNLDALQVVLSLVVSIQTMDYFLVYLESTYHTHNNISTDHN